MRPLVKTTGNIAGNITRKASTNARETAGTASPSSRSMLQIPTWSLVGFGTVTAVFFGKILHDDNLELRRELHELRKELRADRSELREEMNARFKKIDDTIAGMKLTPK